MEGEETPPEDGPQDGYSFLDTVLPDTVVETPKVETPEETPEEKPEDKTPETTPEEKPEDKTPEEKPEDKTPEEKPEDKTPEEEEEEEISPEDLIPGAEKKTTEDKSGETKEFPDADEVPELEGKAKAKWGEIRTELYDTRSELSEANKQIEALKAQAPVKELENTITELQSEVTELRQTAGMYSVEHTEAYKQQVEAPLQAIMDTTEQITNRYEGMDQERVFDALAMEPGDEQNNILQSVAADMSERDRVTLYNLADDATKVFALNNQMKENAAELAKEYESEQDAVAKAERDKEITEVRSFIPKVFDQFKAKAPEIEGVDMDKLVEDARSEDFGSLSAPHKAYALASGTLLPKMITAVKTQEAKIAELNKTIADMKAATPGAGGGSPSGGGSGDGSDEGGSFFDVIDGELNKIGQ